MRYVSPLTFLSVFAAMLVLLTPRSTNVVPLVVWTPVHVAPITGGAR